jgi:hypothetical protein
VWQQLKCFLLLCATSSRKEEKCGQGIKREEKNHNTAEVKFVGSWNQQILFMSSVEGCWRGCARGAVL